MTLPEGFRATLFAGEPDVVQPIAFTIDPRGRLWVAENMTYPAWRQKPSAPDRIIILDDADGDGRLDRRKVFWDQGNTVSGLALGFGGVYVCATPNLLFIPDRDGDDVPDGPPTVVLDGWDVKAQHNLFNALTWGPDGWLYGCNGIMSNSRVGAPGTPDAGRVPINCGVWRFHPTRKTFEAVAHGTTNPWGLDFDDFGEIFITNCVIPHLFHVVPGAHYQRMYGQDFNPHIYRLMETCADHVHWNTAEAWSDIRTLGVTPTTDQKGGGHAHTGAMIYLGDNWPEKYRNSIFMCNIHGHRVNHDILERRGSGFVARHDADFLLANDPWFRGMELRYGPDGGVFLTDWSDIGECHENDADGAHRENGRIYKITYGDIKPVPVDLAAMSNAKLAALQLHKNDWYVRTARRLLQERAAAGQDMVEVRKALFGILEQNPDETRQLRALWALYATEGLREKTLIGLLDHKSEHLRAWAVRLLAESTALAPDSRPAFAVLDDRAERAVELRSAFAILAEREPSPRVRLQLASALQRFAVEVRWLIARGLLHHAEDASDPMIPLMIWYGLEPLASQDPSKALALAESSEARIPIVRQNLVRRVVAGDAKAGLALVVPKLDQIDDPQVQRDWLLGIIEALRGRKKVPQPEGWPRLFTWLRGSNSEVSDLALRLGLILGDPKAVAVLRATLESPTAPPEARTRALQPLVEQRTPGLVPPLLALLGDRALRGPALRALAVYPDDATAPTILGRYREFNDPERADAIQTLATRPSDALALLDAVEKGVVPARDLTATTARQLQAFGEKRINEKLEKVWGTIRPTARAKTDLMARYQADLTSERLKTADLAQGRLVFQRNCAQCHRLNGEGGDVGPDLTGSDRANLSYVLENVLDPSATVGRDYRLTTIATTDGRLLSGIIREQNDQTLTIQTVNDRLTLDRSEIEEMKPSPQSMMPEGLFEKLTPDEVRDLVAYLAAKASGR
jgi:putative membrane-bound dehydrogenase-like protein